MENDIALFSQEYKSATLGLTLAVSDMINALDTPEFDDAFWKVQQASERVKRLRSSMEHLLESDRNSYTLVPS